MKLISWNVNGLRAVARKGFQLWLRKSGADIICLQETKAHPSQLPKELLQPVGYYSYFNSAQKKGYSGVAVYTKKKPRKIETRLGLERFDEEGRMLQLTFSDFILINLYLPQGGRDKHNLGYKLATYSFLLRHLKKIREKKVIVVGDFNIAHEEIDLARPQANENNIMFTKEERKQITDLISLGFIDTFRSLHPQTKAYSWWPYLYHSRERNIGWRIDYVFISSSLRKKLKSSFILTKVTGSDHCPVGIELLTNF